MRYRSAPEMKLANPESLHKTSTLKPNVGDEIDRRLTLACLVEDEPYPMGGISQPRFDKEAAPNYDEVVTRATRFGA